MIINDYFCHSILYLEVVTSNMGQYFIKNTNLILLTKKDFFLYEWLGGIINTV